MECCVEHSSIFWIILDCSKAFSLTLQVQLLYHDSSLGRPVNFVLKRLDILKEEATGLLRPPDIDRFLSNFCNWQRTQNPVGDREPLHWDHALILTGLDLYVRGKHGKISNQVVGRCLTWWPILINPPKYLENHVSMESFQQKLLHLEGDI